MHPGSNVVNHRGHRGRENARLLVGVELGPVVLRASVFVRGPELVGKMKLSTKPERGAAAVLERIERCVRYAVDESDYSFESVAAIGVAVPDGLVSPDGVVTIEPDFGWHEVPFKQRLEAHLGRPVFVANAYRLAALAVAALEPHASAAAQNGGMGVLIPGARLGAGLVREGVSHDLSTYPAGRPVLRAGAANVVQQSRHARYQGYRARDFRKAIRSGDRAAERFILQSVRRAMKFGAALVRRGLARRLVLAGGAIDENKSSALAEARRALQAELRPGRSARKPAVTGAIPKTVPVWVSNLGDQAALMGAVLMADRGVHAWSKAPTARPLAPRPKPKKVPTA